MNTTSIARMDPLRLAILFAFVGATFWVFVPLLNIGWTPPPGYVDWSKYGGTNRSGLADLIAARRSTQVPASGKRELRTGDVRSETIVLTIASVSWILASLVKLKL